jgi:hypothetical protein
MAHCTPHCGLIYPADSAGFQRWATICFDRNDLAPLKKMAWRSRVTKRHAIKVTMRVERTVRAYVMLQ